jgi:hypothetical protein
MQEKVQLAMIQPSPPRLAGRKTPGRFPLLMIQYQSLLSSGSLATLGPWVDSQG